MAVYYTLIPIDCEEPSSKDECRCLLQRTDADYIQNCADVVIEVISPEQFDSLDLLNEVSNDFLHSLVKAESNFADVYADHVIGSFAVPDKKNIMGTTASFAFYMNKQYLIFADSSGTAESILEDVASMGIIGGNSTAHSLYVFIKQLLVNDVEYMSEIEAEMEQIEEDMLEWKKDVDTVVIMGYRRQSMKLSSYYGQIATMADVLADNENKLLTAEECKSFDNISNYADRLVTRGESLESYSLQLHDLHTTRIDLKQNSIMQVLTIVTVLIAPLTLLTGWFGMNIPIPGLNDSFMWIVLIAVGVLITLLLVLQFRRKHWL